MIPFSDFPSEQKQALEQFAAKQEAWQQHIIDVLDRMRRQLIWRYLIVVVGLVIAGFLAGYAIHQNARNITDLKKADMALCRLRDDIQNRLVTGEQFLKNHPHGAFGLAAATIQTSLASEASTLLALRPLVCPPP